jgi:hypothetical protein
VCRPEKETKKPTSRHACGTDKKSGTFATGGMLDPTGAISAT